MGSVTRDDLIRQALQEDARRGSYLRNERFFDTPDSQFFATDEMVQADAYEDPELQALAPLYSPMIRTSNVPKKGAELLTMRLSGLFARKECLALEETFGVDKASKFEANEIYLRLGINDSIKGWRLRALVEKIKTQRVQVLEEKKGPLSFLKRGGGGQ